MVLALIKRGRGLALAKLGISSWLMMVLAPIWYDAKVLMEDDKVSIRTNNMAHILLGCLKLYTNHFLH
jgi:hypothetical protein